MTALKWIECLHRHPRITVVITMLLGVAAFLTLFGTTVDNALEVWLVKDTPIYENYRRFVETFGSEEFILVAVHGEGLQQEGGLENLAEATRRVAEVAGIKAVLSPTTILEKMPLPFAQAAKVFMATPTYQRFLVSKDGKTAGIFLTVDPSAASRPDMVKDLYEALDFLRDKGFALHLGGPPVLNAELNTLSAKDPRLLFPIVFAVTLVVLGYLFRSLAGLLVPLATVLVTVLLSLAGVVLLGRQLNMITVGFPTVLWVLTISQSVHLLTSYGRQIRAGLSGSGAVAVAVKNIRYPCFLMSVTTAAGFLSLLFSDLGPVRELGVYTAAGIVVGYFVNIVLGPALLLWKGADREGLKIRATKDRADYIRLVSTIRKRRIWIILAALILIGAATFNAARIEVETNALRFLRKDNPLLADYTFIQANLVGLSSLEVDLDRAKDEPLDAVLERISVFTEKIASAHPECRVLSVDDFLKAAAFAVKAGTGAYRDDEISALRKAAQEFFETSDAKARMLLLPFLRSTTDLSPYITEDDSRLRISIFSPDFEGNAFESFQADMVEAVREVFGPDARVTGIVPLLVSMQEYLLSSQIECLAFALGIIFLFMIMAARSLRLALISMIPNAFPVVLNFGIMGFLNVRLDAATMMIASVAVGIAVDNTIHMIAAFQRLSSNGQVRALERAMEWKGRAILYTTLITCLGFMVLSFSIFMPMAWFGGLTGLTIFWALLGNFIIYPALLTFTREAQK